LNYRWHFSGALESVFLGSYLRYRVYKGHGTSEETKFEFTLPELTVGLNIGKRWVWDSGFNITFALGYGISKSSRDIDPNSDTFKSTLENFEKEYDFVGPFLGEFSLGYAF